MEEKPISQKTASKSPIPSCFDRAATGTDIACFLLNFIIVTPRGRTNSHRSILNEKLCAIQQHDAQGNSDASRRFLAGGCSSRLQPNSVHRLRKNLMDGAQSQ